MSVPEGKMRLVLERTELWALHLALKVALSDYPYPGESLSGRIRPLLSKIDTYLEATDGPQTHTVCPDAPKKAGLG